MGGEQNLPSYLKNSPLTLCNKHDTLPFILPNRMNKKDCSTNVTVVDDDGLIVHYNGLGARDADSGIVRSNYPIPDKVGIFYFEVEIISKGRDGLIGVGFCEKEVPLDRLPGWESKSFGYHGDDGNKFESTGTGAPYGPLFTTGDTIGCAINFFSKKAFYTKNGKNLGVAFQNLPEPFKFNIEDYAETIFEIEKNNHQNEITQWYDNLIINQQQQPEVDNIE
ncbi:Ran-binding protein 10 [Rhizophagus irregularis DAOM 181602=DAOM 197198]|nr:Ran-binding protein 10 [Rhizophagus irregularis DAOM 181602=DAOM 197198]